MSEYIQGRQLLKVFERGFDMYTKAGRDYTKLQDFRVTDGPPVQTFDQGPECAALLADVVGPHAAKLQADFDPSRVLFRPFQNKAHFCGIIQAVVENWAGVGLDTVEPIVPHTTANDLHAHGCGILTYVSEGGFQQRVVLELQLEYGLNGLLVANSRAEFPELCVRFTRDKSLHRAVGQYLVRQNGERVQVHRRDVVRDPLLNFCAHTLGPAQQEQTRADDTIQNAKPHVKRGLKDPVNRSAKEKDEILLSRWQIEMRSGPVVGS
jgi:hypothetical protein